MTTTSPAPTAHLLQQWERFFLTGEEQFTDAEFEAWDCDIGHLVCEAHASEDAYLYALGALRALGGVAQQRGAHH